MKQARLEKFGVKIKDKKKDKRRQMSLDDIDKLKQLAKERETRKITEMSKRKNEIGKEIEELVKKTLKLERYKINFSPDLFGMIDGAPAYVEVKHSSSPSVYIYYDQLKRVHEKNNEVSIEGKRARAYYAFVFTDKKEGRTLYLVPTDKIMQLIKSNKLNIRRSKWGMRKQVQNLFNEIPENSLVKPNPKSLERVKEIRNKVKRPLLNLSKKQIEELAYKKIRV